MSEKEGKTTEERIRAVRITLWLGADQEVSIKLGKTLGKRLDGPDRDFERNGFATDEGDLEALVRELLDKLLRAFPNKEPIVVNIDEFDRPVLASVTGTNKK